MATLTLPTLDRLLKETRVFLGQENAANSTWSDAELTMYLNDAFRVYFLEVSERAEGQFDTQTTLDIVSGVEVVDLPSDCFKVKVLWKIANQQDIILSYKNNLSYSRDNLPDQNPDTYEPYYYFRGNAIILNPTPSFTQADGLRLEYTQFPEQMIYSGDVISAGFSPVFKEMLVMYAVYKAKVKESLVTGTNTYEAVKEHLTDLYTIFKEDVGLRSKYPQFIKPFIP